MSSQVTESQILICSAASAEKIGLNEAIVLQQIFHWQKKRGDGEWIDNSLDTWQKQLKYLSFRTIRRTFASLVRHGFLESKKGKRCRLYRLRYEAAQELLLDFNSHAVVTAQDLVIERCEGDIPKQMLEIWQQKIPPTGHALILTDKRRRRLKALLTNTFNCSLQQWSEFVDSITISNFLMGKVGEFKATLDWAISPDVCVRILEGAYTNNRASSNVVSPEKMQKDVNACLELIQDKEWKETSKLLVQILGLSVYQSWISKTQFNRYENSSLYLEATTRFIGDWICGHYTHKILQAWREATHKNALSLIIKPQRTQLPSL